MATAAGEQEEDYFAAEVPLALRRFGATPNPYLELMRRSGAKSPHHSPSSNPKSTPLPSIPSPPASPTAAAAAISISASSASALPPPWLRKDDREVLRYYVYHLETVHAGGDPGQAAVRVRRFTACYFTACESWAVQEPREANSGIPQGTFLKKQRIPNMNPAARGDSGQQAWWGPEDVEVGKALNFFGRDFVVIDADAFTRAWHQRVLGRALDDPLPRPDDGYRTMRQLIERPARRQHQAPQQQQQQPSPPSSADSGGSNISSAGLTSKKKPLPYPQRDIKVLRFFGAYQDAVGGQQHKVTIHYFTEDDKMEINEAREPGRDPFPSMLKRSRVPKGGSQPQQQQEGAPCYMYTDLICGASIKIYGRRVLLLSCDASTAAWYAAKGIRQNPLHVATSGDAAPPTPLQVAPPNGFGDDTDLYSLGLRLEPGKYERKEHAERSQQMLRFKVHLLRNGVEDTTRDLILKYNLFDDTLSIFEPPVRNSGQDGGLFLTRGRYKKYIEKAGTDRDAALGGSLSRYLRPSDFLLTAGPVTFEVATTGARLFQLVTVAYEERTRHALEAMGVVGNPRDPRAVSVALHRQAEAFVSLPVRAVFRAATATHDNGGAAAVPPSTVPLSTFLALVRQLEVQAGAPASPEEELAAVAAAFAHPTRDGVCYDDYVDALCLCAPKTVLDQAKEAIGVGQLTVEERVLKALSLAYQHGKPLAAVLLRRVLRAHDPAGAGEVDFDGFSRSLKAVGMNEVISENEANTALLQYGHETAGGADCLLSYPDLCDSVHSTFDGDLDVGGGCAGYGSGGGGTKAGNKHNPPTIGRYLAEVTRAALTCDNDRRQQLENAIHAFSSCFSRLNRKRILRKIWGAFDGKRTGLITGPHFTQGVKEAALECRVDISAHDTATLTAFIFPAGAEGGAGAGRGTAVDYEKLLEAMCSRDIARVAAVRDAGLEERARLEEQVFKEPDDKSRARDFGSILKGAGLVA